MFRLRRGRALPLSLGDEPQTTLCQADSIKRADHDRGRRPRHILDDIRQLYAPSQHVSEARSRESEAIVRFAGGGTASIDLRYTWRVPRSSSARTLQLFPDPSEVRDELERGGISISPRVVPVYSYALQEGLRLAKAIEKVQRGDSLTPLDSQLLRVVGVELIRHPRKLVRVR